MLDTLREATEEEYRDALEREAARNAEGLDTVPEESARNVVIIVNPRESDNDEDFVSGSSHVHESRCIHPLENTLLGRMGSLTNSFNTLPEAFKLSKLRTELPHRNLFQADSNMGASNIEESIVDVNRNSQPISTQVTGIKQKNHKNALEFSNLNKLKNFNDKLFYINENSVSSLEPKSMPRSYLVAENLNSAPRNIEHQLKSKDDKINQLFRNNKVGKLNLRNILKLKDVELVPKTIRNKSLAKPKIDISHFAIPTLLSNNKHILNKNCVEPIIYDSNQASESLIKDIKQKEIDAETSESITDIKNTEQKPNIRINSTPEPKKSFRVIVTENFSDDDDNDFFESQKVNLVAPLLNQTKAEIPVNRVGIEKESENIISPKNTADCDINTPQKTDFDAFEKVENLFTGKVSTKNVHDEAIESLQDQNTNPDIDSETDSSNVVLSSLEPLKEIITNVSTESQEDIAVLTKSSSDEDDCEEKNAQLRDTSQKTLKESNYVPTLGETLSKLRKNVVKQLGNLKDPLTKSDLRSVIDDKDKVYTDIERHGSISESILNSSSINNEIKKITMDLDPLQSASIEENESVDDLSIKDLQNMSDKLLDSDLVDQSYNDFSNESETKIKSRHSEEETDSKLSETKLNPENIELNNAKNSENLGNNACLTDLGDQNDKIIYKNIPKLVTQELKQTEMDTGASDTVLHTLPSLLDTLNPNLKLHSPLLNDITLQSPSEPFNLLGKPLGGDLNLNSNLPTIDELRERLSNIFNTNDESSEDYLSSHENDFTNEYPLETMATDATIRNSHKELPLLREIENFHRVINNNKPKISNPFDGIMQKNGLQLNSFRAHLPSPTTLDLKPVKIEPKHGNKLEILKPFNVFETDVTLPRKVKPTKILAKPLDGIATLEDLRDAIRSNAKSLLDSSGHSEISPFSKKISSDDIEDVAKNIRINTEKTFKGLQRKMKLTSMKNPLSDSFAKPQDLLDDVNDKLKGIHYDLNDRLSSIRESILDSAKIKSFVEPPRKTANRNVMTNLKKIKLKSTPSGLRTAASTPTPNKLKDWSKSSNTQTAAASDPSPATVESPKYSNTPLFSNSNKIPLPLRQHPLRTELLRERMPLHRDITPTKNTKSPIFRSTVSPVTRTSQPKVTVSFGTTPRSTILPTLPVIRVPNMQRSQFEDNNSISSNTINEAGQGNSVADEVSISRSKPLRISAPIPSPFDEDYEDTLSNFSDEEPPARDTSIFKSPVFREMAKSNNQPVLDNFKIMKSINMFDSRIKNLDNKSSIKISNWPKVSEGSLKSLSSNVQQAVNIRKLKNKPESVEDARNEQLGMLRSATKNADIAVINEPLKENVSYRCRMVCTKEIR